MDDQVAPHIVRLSFVLLDHSAHFVVRYMGPYAPYPVTQGRLVKT
jgi:hypothetical protein